MQPPTPRLTRNVLALGLVSFFTDVSSEMIVPLLPVFLASIGASAAALGLIEGVADGVAAFLKLWSGRAADRLGRRRPFLVGGYALSSFVRPLVSLAVLPAHVLTVRVLDRVGKGLRSSPRDALLADSVEPERRGAAFGFNRAMDHAGAVVGPLVAMAILAWWTEDLRLVFAASALPAALAVLVLVLGVREPPPAAVRPEVAKSAEPAPRGEVWRTVVPTTMFALGKASDSFLLLRAAEVGLAPVWMPLLWTGLHAVKSASALPGGWLADHLGPRGSLCLGWAVYVLAYAALAVADSPGAVILIVLAYGLHHGLSEPAERVLVAGSALRGRTGEAFGWYHLGLGLAAVVASVGFGFLWQGLGHEWAFGLGSAVAALAILLLLVVGPPSARSGPAAARVAP